MKDLHPELAEGEKARRLESGIELFNRGEFFASHEPWEEVWRSTRPEPRALFQGLVQIAAAFHHWQNAGRRGSAQRLLARGRGHLENLAPTTSGLDLAAFLDEIAVWQRWLESAPADESPPPYPSLRPSPEALP